MFVRCIAERYPTTSFQIYTSSAYAQPFQRISNITNFCRVGRFIDRVCNKTIGKQIGKRCLERNADATVHIGGSIFIEPEHFVPPREYYSNPNLYIIGCNYGPSKTEAYYDYIWTRLQKAQDVCFRDGYSYGMFSSLKHVRVAPDVLFGYPDYPAPKKGHGVGISVISLDERPGLKHMADAYYRSIAQVIDQCAQRDVSVKLFGFCSDEGDRTAIEHIKNRCKTGKFEICEYDGNIDGMLDDINACEYMIASRFHAMIIGWCLSKKVFPVVYSDKQLHVMDDVGYTGDYWDLREKKEYTAESIICNIHEAVTFRVDEYKRQSKLHFNKLDDYLKNSVTIGENKSEDAERS